MVGCLAVERGGSFSPRTAVEDTGPGCLPPSSTSDKQPETLIQCGQKSVLPLTKKKLRLVCRNLLFYMVGDTRFEPVTSCL